MGSNKKLSFKVTYNNETKLFSCEQHEAIDAIAAHFGINIRDVTMYSLDKGNKRLRISPDPGSISDFMKIIMVSRENGQRNIHDYIDSEESKKMIEEASKKMVANISKKLRENTPLNGQERKVLIEALETHSTAILKKRKLDDMDVNKKIMIHKKVQVNMPSKESFTQTESFDIPINGDSNHVTDEEENAKLTLKKLWHRDNKADKDVELLMKKTFEERRTMITLKCPPVSFVKEQYPALFCVEQVKSELDRIFYPGKCVEFLNNMTIYPRHILHYAKDLEKVSDVFEKIEKARKRSQTQTQKTYADTVGSIFVLARLLEEDFSFVHLNDYPHSSKDVFPFIDASLYSLSKIFFDDKLFHINVEGQHLCECSNFSEALLCLMGAYFIFNINYPESCHCTLTVIEKVFLKANDTMDIDEKTSQWIKLLTIRAKGKS